MFFGVRISSLYQQNLPSDFRGDYGSFSFGSFLGEDISGKETIYLGVDYARFSLRREPGGEIYSRQLVPCIGLRYYLLPRFQEKVTVALVMEVFKTYTKLKHTQGGLYSGEDLGYLQDLYSPWGFVPSFYAEYRFSPGFSLSGQFGLRFSSSKGSISGSANFTDGETRLNSAVGSVSIILNYRWRNQ